MSENKKNNVKGKKILKRFFIVIFIIILTAIICSLILLYGPGNKFRDWLITTSLSSMNHKKIATNLYSEGVILDTLSRNSIEDLDVTTDTSLINIGEYNLDAIGDNEYEKEILDKDESNNDYKLIRIEEDKFSGYLAVIYDPTRVKLTYTKYLGISGEYLEEMSKDVNSFIAINAGGFLDDADATAGIPYGNIIFDGDIIYEGYKNTDGGLIGFNDEGKLILGKISAENATYLGIQYAVDFSPFLIVNGDPLEITGNGGGGRAPRTAIAQRADGIVLFLVLDGNRTIGRGATYKDEQDILLKYGAINAANLDGGTSTQMTLHDTLINDPTTKSGKHRTRPIATAFYLEADDEDNGDSYIIENLNN